MAHRGSVDLLDRAHEGAVRVLRDCLSLSPGDAAALFGDESAEPCTAVLKNVARELGIHTIDRFVPHHEQLRRTTTGEVSPDDRVAIDSARAVLICLAAGPATLAYRKALVNASVDVSRYVGVIPGATLEVLAHAVNIDYEAVRERCDDLAVAMLVGQDAVLTSERYGTDGRLEDSCDLVMKLDGFRRSPITSTGVIPRDTWGNLPGGETFIAPLEGTATGRFVLNGSYSGHVMHADELLLLDFDAGRLVDVHGAGPGRAPFDKLIGWPACRSCAPLSLAELGVGVNSGIDVLTGNPLFDEKKEGTAHIAVGDNSIYGGQLRSHLHEDFITRRPSLTIDGHVILTRGECVLDRSHWREDFALVEQMGRDLPSECLIAKRPLHASADRQGRLTVRREVGAKRKCIYTVGATDVSLSLAQFYALLPPIPESISLSLLAEQWRAATGSDSWPRVKGLVAVLEKHELISSSLLDD